MGRLGNEFHYFSKCQIPSIVKVRKEFNDLSQITDKNTIIDKIFEIDDKNYQHVGKVLHNLLEKYKEEFDRIIVNSQDFAGRALNI